ncbi:unnamed protein product [Paramecium octaurelia]|uniref:Tetraspanin n=1 Tax=Paramecium octaurelia TaxID=43137 RepID=A0A8S1SWS3_PAROT|nr:unnamed protein product [Paramecium octaurelia]CAD8143194.1 unnamed protein product [Paramecium octaurelia]
MCLPLGCLKFSVQFQAWIILIVGVSSLIGTIVINVDQRQYLDYLDEFTNSKPSDGILIALYIFSSILILFGICGIIGGWKRIGTLLFCFNIGNFLLALAFLGLAILGFSLGQSAHWIDIFSDEQCFQSEYFTGSATLNNVYAEAEAVFCKTIYQNAPGCQCYYTGSMTDNTSQSVQFYSNSNADLPIRIQQCQQYNDYKSDYDEEAEYLKSIEEQFSCSGWCLPYQIYIFSDVNAGTPKDNCYGAITGFAKDICIYIGAVAVSVCFIMILCITCVLCLCFHPTKKQEGNFYSRMAHYD